MSIHSLTFEDFFALKSPILDVRSPQEFFEGHIPAAMNLPLFSDQQRSEIGILYKSSGKVPAIEKGFEFIGRDIRRLTQGLTSVANESGQPLRLHCWRGGMRSQSVAWYAQMLGLEVATLKGGYKTYRAQALKTFKLPWKIVTLSGLTGAGKTEVLKHLAASGEQVVDLEGLANHRGSAFGWIGLPPQPANQLFENLLFETLKDLDPNRRVWVEDEARAIGKIRVPQDFWACMRLAPVLFIDVSLERRINNLLDVYGGFPSQDLAKAIEQIHKRFGSAKTTETLESLDAGDLRKVTRLALEYYDHAYSRSASRRVEKNVFRLVANETHEEIAKQLSQAADQIDTLPFKTMSAVLGALEKSVAKS